jgi:hypothetical protein
MTVYDNPGGPHRWTGAELRAWAGEVAQRLDAELDVMTMDVDHYGVGRDIFKINLTWTEKAHEVAAAWKSWRESYPPVSEPHPENRETSSPQPKTHKNS